MSDIVELIIGQAPSANAPDVTEWFAPAHMRATFARQEVGTVLLQHVPVAQHIAQNVQSFFGHAVSSCWSLRPEDVLRLKGAAFGYSDDEAVRDFASAARALLDGRDAWAVIVETNTGPDTTFIHVSVDRVTEVLLRFFSHESRSGYGGLIILPPETSSAR